MKLDYIIKMYLHEITHFTIVRSQNIFHLVCQFTTSFKDISIKALMFMYGKTSSQNIYI